MKQLLLSFSLIICYLTLSAQSKFAVGTVASIDLCGLSNRIGHDNGIVADYYKRTSAGYQAGLRLRYTVSDIISVQTGLTMISHQVHSDKTKLYSLVSGDPGVAEYVKQYMTYKSLQVPVLCSFYFGDQWKFGFSAGVAYNYIYRDDGKAYLYFPDEKKEITGTYALKSKNQFLSAIAGVGVEYAVPGWTFRAEPTLNYQLYFFDNSFVNDDYRLWSAGLAVSGYYHF